MKRTNRTELSSFFRPARVVVGVTGSAGSGAALRMAADEARRSGRGLVAVLAWEPPGGEAAYRLAPDPALVRIWERAAMERLSAAFADAFAEAVGGAPEDLAVERVVVRGPAALALTSLAERPSGRTTCSSWARAPATRSPGCCAARCAAEPSPARTRP